MTKKIKKEAAEEIVQTVPDLSEYEFPEDYQPFSDENLDMLP
ncbi:MAG TPA: hypothetical protein VJ856_00600 [Paludibacteraceae bacterium]|nr:hypothetical protein [Paludibacteraceae bacterium]